MSTESQQQIARKATLKIQELPNGLRVHPGKITNIILSAIAQAHQDGWHEGRNYEAKFGVKPQHSEQRTTGLWTKWCQEINAELATERQRSKELCEDLEHYSEVIDKREQQLLSAQAAIEKHNKRRGVSWNVDLSLLHQHDAEVEQRVLAKVCSMISERNELDANRDAEVRKPLVDALKQIAENDTISSFEACNIAADALAKQ